MVTFAVFHLLAGFLIGARFRFGALFPAFAAVAVETVAVLFVPIGLSWYMVLITGIVALQVGYVAAIVVRPADELSARQADVRSYRSRLRSG